MPAWQSGVNLRPANLKRSDDFSHLLAGRDLNEVRDALQHQEALPAVLGGGEARRVGAVDGPRMVGAGCLAGEIQALHWCREPGAYIGRLSDQVA